MGVITREHLTRGIGMITREHIGVSGGHGVELGNACSVRKSDSVSQEASYTRPALERPTARCTVPLLRPLRLRPATRCGRLQPCATVGCSHA